MNLGAASVQVLLLSKGSQRLFSPRRDLDLPVGAVQVATVVPFLPAPALCPGTYTTYTTRAV